MMKADRYLKALTKRIENSRMREEILREYQDHIQDCKEALMESGMSEEAAEEEAVRQMGDPGEAGREMNRLYRQVLDLGMTLWFLGMCLLLLPFRWLIEYDLPLTVLEYIGRAFVIYGLLLSAWEKYHDLEIGYVHAGNWTAGMGAMNNSGLILAIGAALLAHDIPRGLWLTLTLAVVQILLRSFIQMMNQKRETELLWQVGIADTAVSYKGKGTFCGRQMKIKARDDEIPPGMPIIIVAMEGPKPVVERV